MGGERPAGSDSDVGDAEAVLSRSAFVRIVGGATGAFVLGYLIDAVWARMVRGVRLERDEYPRLVLGEVRVHHNVAGYLLIAVGVFVYPFVLIPLGLGIIVGHGVRDRWWFVERVE